jgi:hypothetical protein
VTGVDCELDYQLRGCMGEIVKRSAPSLCSYYLTIEKLGVNTGPQWRDKKYVRFNLCIDPITRAIGYIVGNRLGVVVLV